MKTQYRPLGTDATVEAILDAHARGNLNAWTRNFNATKVHRRSAKDLRKSKSPALREVLSEATSVAENFLATNSANGVGGAGVASIKVLHARGPGHLSKATGLPPQSSNAYNDTEYYCITVP